MSFEDFKQAVDSMEGYPKMTGVMGGEPLLHPEFEKFCKYIGSKIQKNQLGLWTSFPKGLEYYREIICETFGHIFLNDHTREDIYHHPALVAIEEVVPDKNQMWYFIDHCWAQEAWSASINPKGAFFCEIAASMAMLFNEECGWKVEKGWWWRVPKDFKEQIEQYCPRCGFCAPLHRRKSTENIDDISPNNFERLKDQSIKIKRGQYKIHDLAPSVSEEPLAAYKDIPYRDKIAARYGIFLIINDQQFWSPYLLDNWSLEKFNEAQSKTLLQQYQEKWKNSRHT